MVLEDSSMVKVGGCRFMEGCGWGGCRTEKGRE